MFIPKRGENNKKFYQVLEVEQDATEDDIKRAYKKMALKYHPDKNPGSEDKFKEISNAYNVLLDPQKRQVYDMYGEEGLTFFENGMFGEEGELMQILPFLQNPVGMFGVCCIGFLIVAVAFLVPLFIVLKVDNVVDWAWPVVFVPLWIVNVVPAIYACCSPFSGAKVKGVVTLLQYLCSLTFEILLCIQLERGSFTWAVVFIPVYIFEALHLSKCVAQSRRSKYFEAVETTTAGALFGLGYAGFLIKRWFIPSQRVLFIILIVVRLDNTSWGWGIPAIPIFVSIAWKLFIKIADDITNLKGVVDNEERSARKSMYTVLTVLLSIVLAFALTFVILIVFRLNGASYSLAITFIPLFIVFGLAFCVCCCLAPCFICCAGKLGDDDPNMQSPDENNGVWWEIKRQRYLENTKPTETDPLKV